MAIVKKKCYPEFFELLMKGRKRFEFRIADFDIEEGDTLILQEWDPKTKRYTGRSIIKTVGYIVRFTLDDIEKRFGQKELLEKYGFYILQLD